MYATLSRLMDLMPPPKNLRFARVQWERLENAIGMAYPSSFKEFIGVYGGSVWFDNLSPFYTEAKSDGEVKKFLKSVEEKLKRLRGNTYDEDYNCLELPLFPEKGGLLPFMIDYAGNLYNWLSVQENPEKWPIAVWLTGSIRMLDGMTISSMILDWLERKPLMIELWGDVQEFDPKRLCLTETSAPDRKKERKKNDCK